MHASTLRLAVVSLLLSYTYSNCIDMANDLAFKDDSYGPPYSNHKFKDQNNPFSARINYPLPTIVVQILDENRNVFREAELFKVKVSLDTGELHMLPITLPFVRGEAVFRDRLKFLEVPPTEVRLKFECFPPLTRNQTLFSDYFSVVPDEKGSQNVQLQFPEYNSYFRNREAFLDTPQAIRQVTLDYVVPRFEVLVVYPWGEPATQETGNVVVEAMVRTGAAVDSAFVVTGNTAPMVGGSAVFQSFKLTATNYKQRTYLRFTFYRVRPAGTVGNDNPMIGLVPVIVNKEPVPTVSLQFGTVRESFLHAQLPEATAAHSETLPTIVVDIIDSAGQKDGSGTDLVMKAVCSMGDTLLYNEAPINLGRAVFTQLKFPPISDPTWVSIAFSVLSMKILYKLWSPPIYLQINAEYARYIQFLPNTMRSFFSYNNQNDRIAQTMQMLPEIVIVLMRSSHKRDLVTMNVMIEVKYAGITVTYPVVDGIAIIRNVRFTQPGINTITFSCRAPGKNADGYRLTATVNVMNQVPTSYGIEFDRNGYSIAPFGSMIYTTLGVCMPRITVNMVDAAGVLDATNSDTTITASAEGCFLRSSTVTMFKGQAIFGCLMLLDTASQPALYLTFTAGSEGSWPVSGKTIVTGKILVVLDDSGVQSGTTSALVFERSLSYIQFEGHSVVASSTGTSLGRDITVKVMLLNGTTNYNYTGVVKVSYGDAELGIPAEFDSFYQVPLEQGVAKISKLKIPSGAKHYQALTICVDPEIGDFSCVSSGPLYLGSVTYPFYFVDLSSPDSGVRIYEPKGMMTQTVSILDHNFAPVAKEIYNQWTLRVACAEKVRLEDVNGDRRNTRLDAITLSDSRIVLTWNFTDLPWLQSYTPVLTFTAAPKAFNDISIRGFVDTVGITGSVYRRPITTRQQVLVFEILTDYTSFTVGGGNKTWFQDLSQFLRLDLERIEMMSVAQGSAILDYSTKRRWKGTRVELRFSPPGYQHVNRAPSQQLVDALLDMKLSLMPQLMLRRIVRLEDDKVCDLYRFRAQVKGAEHCVKMSETVGRGRCTCFNDFFVVLGQYCAEYAGMVEVCNYVKPCDQNLYPAMQTACATVESAELLRSALIGGLLAIGFIVLGVLYGFKSGYFQRKFSSAKLYKHSIQKTDEEMQDHAYSML